MEHLHQYRVLEVKIYWKNNMSIAEQWTQMSMILLTFILFRYTGMSQHAGQFGKIMSAFLIKFQVGLGLWLWEVVFCLIVPS